MPDSKNDSGIPPENKKSTWFDNGPDPHFRIEAKSPYGPDGKWDWMLANRR